jgi:hypothetical protein
MLGQLVRRGKPNAVVMRSLKGRNVCVRFHGDDGKKKEDQEGLANAGLSAEEKLKLMGGAHTTDAQKTSVIEEKVSNPEIQSMFAHKDKQPPINIMTHSAQQSELDDDDDDDDDWDDDDDDMVYMWNEDKTEWGKLYIYR